MLFKHNCCGYLMKSNKIMLKVTSSKGFPNKGAKCNTFIVESLEPKVIHLIQLFNSMNLHDLSKQLKEKRNSQKNMLKRLTIYDWNREISFVDAQQGRSLPP